MTLFLMRMAILIIGTPIVFYLIADIVRDGV